MGPIGASKLEHMCLKVCKTSTICSAAYIITVHDILVSLNEMM